MWGCVNIYMSESEMRTAVSTDHFLLKRNPRESDPEVIPYVECSVILIFILEHS